MTETVYEEIQAIIPYEFIHLRFDDRLVQQDLNVIDGAENISSGVTIRKEGEGDLQKGAYILTSWKRMRRTFT